MDNADVLPYFVLYYALILALCFSMFQRVRFLKVHCVCVCVCARVCVCVLSVALCFSMFQRVRFLKVSC